MKKTIALITALLLLLCMGVAYAADPITLGISAVDVQTGKVITKTSYAENELFELRVEVGMPRFVSTADLQLTIETDGVEITEQNVELMGGVYYIKGIVIDQPAAIRVKIKDCAFQNADTAEEMYEALQHDRTVLKTFYFYATTGAAAYKAGDAVVIPKTGDASAIAYAVLAVVAAAACWPKRRLR